MEPTIGRIVHYDDGTTLAAIITAVDDGGSVCLCIFTATGLRFEGGTPYSPTPKLGHWNWPPREPAPEQRTDGGVITANNPSDGTMPEQIPSVATSRGKLAAATRWGKADVPERKRDLGVSNLAAHIAAVVATAPPPTPEQARELSRLLTPVMLNTDGGTGDGALVTPAGKAKLSKVIDDIFVDLKAKGY